MFLDDRIHSSTKAAVAWNTTSQLVGKVINTGTTVIISILLARKFGAQGYGDFIKITTYVAFFFLISDFGINAVYLKKSTSQEESSDGWPSLLGLRIGSSFFLVFVALSVLALVPNGATQGYTNFVRLGIILFSPVIIFQALVVSANAAFQKYMRYDLATLSVAAGSLVTLGTLWVAATYANSSFGILLGTLAILGGTMVTAAVSMVLAKRVHGKLSVSFDIGSMKRILLPAIPLGLTLLFNIVYFHADSVILTLTRSTAEVGIYGLSYKVFEVALVVPTFFMNAMYPVLLKATNGKARTEGSEFKRLVRRSFAVLLVASVVSLLVLWAGAPLLSLVKADFVSSVPALRVLSLGLPIFFLSSLAMWSLVALGKQRLLVFVYGASMIGNVVLNALFVPRVGYMAAAWITVFSEGGVLACTGLLLVRFLKTNGRPDTLPENRKTP